MVQDSRLERALEILRSETQVQRAIAAWLEDKREYREHPLPIVRAELAFRTIEMVVRACVVGDEPTQALLAARLIEFARALDPSVSEQGFHA